MSVSERIDNFSGMLRRLLVAAVGIIVAAVVSTELTVWAASPAGFAVGGSVALVGGVAKHVDLLQVVFEHGRLLVQFAGVLFLLMILQQQFTPGMVLGLAAGVGAGSLVSAAATLAVFS